MKLGSQEWLNNAPVKNTPAPSDRISDELTHFLGSLVSSSAISWIFCGRELVKCSKSRPMKISFSDKFSNVSSSERLSKKLLNCKSLIKNTETNVLKRCSSSVILSSWQTKLKALMKSSALYWEFVVAPAVSLWSLRSSFKFQMWSSPNLENKRSVRNG